MSAVNENNCILHCGEFERKKGVISSASASWQVYSVPSTTASICPLRDDERVTGCGFLHTAITSGPAPGVDSHQCFTLTANPWKQSQVINSLSNTHAKADLEDCEDSRTEYPDLWNVLFLSLHIGGNSWITSIIKNTKQLNESNKIWESQNCLPSIAHNQA